MSGLRVGPLLLLTLPGEFSAAVHRTWDGSIRGPSGVFVIGAAQDFLGYDYPAYNYPFALYSADEQLYNPSVTLGDQVTDAGEVLARQLGFTATTTVGAEGTVGGNRYGRLGRPGVQLLAFPVAGDLRAGGFPAVVDGFAAPARVQAASAGQQSSFTLPVTVFPALAARVTRSQGRLTVRVTGGSGAVVAVRWQARDGRRAYTRSVPAGAWTSVTVTDSTGSSVTAAA